MDHSKGSRATAGHKGGGRAVRSEEFLEQRQQRILFQDRRFERVVKLRTSGSQVRPLQEGYKLLRPARLAAQRGREARQALVSPGGGNAESGINQQERRAAQGRKRAQRLNLLAPAGCQRRFVLQEIRNIGAESRGDRLQLFGR